MGVLICGVDEAGRGPVFGPMAMAAVVIEEGRLEELRALGVKDSKLLSGQRREALVAPIKNVVRRHQVALLAPGRIDEAILGGRLNLNWLEAEACAALIDQCDPDVAVVDCPSPNISAYREYLLGRLKNKSVKLVVEHKADVNHLVVAAASILAKVARDAEVEKIRLRVGEEVGSGYLTDPKTREFLRAHHADFPDVFRKSWAPYRELVAARRQSNLDKF